MKENLGIRSLKIGQLARLAGMATSKLRYYDEIGLLLARRQSEKATRTYSEADLNKLESITELQAMGFKLSELIKIKKASGNRMRHGKLLLSALRMRLKAETAALEDAKHRVKLLQNALSERGPGMKWNDGLLDFA